MQLESAARRRAALSLTPLIDVIFILLVFFMLASSFLQWRSLELNVPADGQAAADATAPSVLRIAADGGLTLDGGRVTLQDLAERLPAPRPNGVVVMPAPEVPLQRVVAVLDRLALAGQRDVTLVRE